MVYDEDGDCVPERVGPMHGRYVFGGSPQFTWAPRVSDGELRIDTAESTFEVWRTDERGRKLSDDPLKDRVAWHKRSQCGPGRFEIDVPLRAGEWLRVFDTTWDIAGPPMRVHGDYPIADSCKPEELPGDEGGTVRIRGSNFGDDTRVRLRIHRAETWVLQPEVKGPGELTVRIPPAPPNPESIGAYIDVLSGHSPVKIDSLWVAYRRRR